MGSSTTIRSVGIVGLGDQGTPIAMRLLSAGWPLQFFARRASVQQKFTDLGGQFKSLKDVGATSDVVLIVVVDDAQVQDVLVTDGLLASMRPGSVVVIHSTVRPETCRDMGKIAQEHGVLLLDAPVSGGRDRSYAGRLTLLVGGDVAPLEAARPVFAAYASSAVHMGPLGTGQIAKAINNYFYAVHLATAAKTVELIRAAGIDLKAAAEALPQCSGSSAVLAMQAAREFERTRHDKGSAYAASVLSGVVENLRRIAKDTGVSLDGIDAVVDRALEAETRRDD